MTPELTTLLLKTELPQREIGEGGFEISVRGGRRRNHVAEVREVGDGFMRVVAPLPELPTRFGKGRGRDVILASLLRTSYRASYAKAISLESGGLALAVDSPLAVLDAPSMRGLFLSVITLADIKGRRLMGEKWWDESWQRSLDQLLLNVPLDEDQALRDAAAIFEARGVRVEETERGLLVAELEHDEMLFTVLIRARNATLSLAVYPNLPPVRPAQFGENFMTHLLELNAKAIVAKLGVDANGEIWFLYHVPRLVPELVDHAIAEFASLHEALGELLP